jgi:hypothetical protein
MVYCFSYVFFQYKQYPVDSLACESLGTLPGVSEKHLEVLLGHRVCMNKMLRSTSNLSQDCNNLCPHQQNWRAILCALTFLVTVNLMNEKIIACWFNWHFPNHQ